MMLLLLIATACMAFAAESECVNLCRLLAHPTMYAGKTIRVRATVKPLMHGTYLRESGCDQSLLLVLPAEIPGYKGRATLVKDTNFDSFEEARFNYLPDAPPFSATFTGQLEYKGRGKGFGYNKNHRVRFVLERVTDTQQSPASKKHQ